MENNPILERAKEDLKDIEKKLWIQAYVSRKENPLIDLIASGLLFICSYIALYRYFTKGSPFSFWVHAVAFIGITVCLVIAHCCLNGPLTRKAETLCPITTSDFNTVEINSIESLSKITSRNRFGKFKVYYAGPLTAFFSIVEWIVCYCLLSHLSATSMSYGGILYLVVMCITTSTWFFFVTLLAGQSLLLPLSQEVKTALRKYQKEKKQEAKRLRLAEMEKAKWEQEEKARQKATMEAEATAKAEELQKAEEERRKTENSPALYRDLPIYQQYREEARRRYIGYSSSGSYNRTLTYVEKNEYINRNFSGMYSYSAIETIENDPNLSPSQKEDLKTFLMIYGD